MPENISMDDEFIQKLKEILESNLSNENFGVKELAVEAGISRSQLHRRLHDTVSKSSSQFIREYRLQKAMEMLKANAATASEIAYRVGFSSPTYFSTAFKSFYGYSPGEVKFQKAIKPLKKTFSKKLVAIVPVIILVGLVVFNEAFNKAPSDASEIEKTIVVLPFINDSDNEENLYFCNGIMAGIRDHLAKIPEYSVVSRRSAEKYRKTSSTLKEIGSELGINYVIEGHVQRIGDRAIISAELIQVSDNKVLWSESYNKDVSESFAVQANVVESITNKLETILSPNLSKELSTPPTQDKLAYEYYLRGEEYRFKAYRPIQKNDVWLNLLKKARLSYELALKQDSLFVPAYLGLARTSFEKNISYVLDENNLDEVLMYANRALQLNPNSANAYFIRANYYRANHQYEKAITDYQRTLEIIPNNTVAYYSLINLYKRNNNYKDAVLTLQKLENFAISRSDLIRLYNTYIGFYRILNEHDMVDYYYNLINEIETTPSFDMGRFWSYIQSNRFDEPINYVKENQHEDNQQRNGLLAYAYYRKKDTLKALEYYKKCFEQVEKEGMNSLASMFVYSGYGYALIRAGQIDKGKELLRKQISINNKNVNSKRSRDKPIFHLYSFEIYAYFEEYEEMRDQIQKFEEENGWLYWEWMVFWVQNDHSYEFLSKIPEFMTSIEKGEKQVQEIQNQIRSHLPVKPPTDID